MFKRFVCLAITGFFLSLSFAQQLVLPGDHPDPSVVKIGNTYWASATTSNWFPAFPLLRSDDLVNWKQQGYVFTKKPDWADFYFWAPEISYENGKVYIYYSAHKKDGNLCVGVASADKPEGPYTDHGPLICQPAGSIDGFPIRDENGKLYLVWKEDGNSVGQPTPIWASEMNEARTALTGEKRELFRNDQPWEHNLVEGVAIVKQGGYYYSLYAAAGCCGVGCNYAVGVARSKSLFGPWEKDPANPVLANAGEWVCPGHGTVIEKGGKFYFLYHGYNKNSHAYTGREGLLQEFIFNNDGWITFVKQPAAKRQSIVNTVDNFNTAQLSEQWQWSVFEDTRAVITNGQLVLRALPTDAGAYVGRKTFSGSYDVTAKIIMGKSQAWAGIAAIGDDKNTVSLLEKNGMLKVVVLRNGKDSTGETIGIKTGSAVFVKMQFRNGLIHFLYSRDGKSYQLINRKPLDGRFLPPWDRAVRVGLVSKGNAGELAVFDDFKIITTAVNYQKESSR